MTSHKGRKLKLITGSGVEMCRRGPPLAHQGCLKFIEVNHHLHDAALLLARFNYPNRERGLDCSAKYYDLPDTTYRQKPKRIHSENWRTKSWWLITHPCGSQVRPYQEAFHSTLYNEAA